MPFVQLNGQVVTLQPGGDSAEDHRKQTMEFSKAPGPVDWGSFRATVVSGLTVNFGEGAAFVRSPNDGSLYRVSQDGVDARMDLTTANGSNPRVDQIGIRVYDDSVDGSGQYVAQIETIDGTPTAGATLDNRNGAPNPSSALTGANAWMAIADALVPAGSASIGGLRNRRPVGQLGMLPPLAIGSSSNNVDIVHMIPSPGMRAGNIQIHGQDVQSKQAAALQYLPRAIAADTVMWAYYVDSLGAGSKNYKIAIFDASGRYIADTGNILWTGSTGNVTRVSAALTVPSAGYVFDVNYYYVVLAHGTGMVTTDSVYAISVLAGNPSGQTINTPVSGPNQFLGSQINGLTLPVDFRAAASAFVDVGVSAANLAQSPVPVIALANLS